MSGSVDQAGLNQAQTVSHFWVSTYPFFESSIFLCASPHATKPANSVIYIYDSDGSLINEVTVTALPAQTGILELEQLLGACKIECGIKHAHLEVHSEAGIFPVCRLHSRSGACILGESALVSLRQSAFFPVTLGDTRSSILTLINHSDRDASIRVRLYHGKRMPEIQIEVPAAGSRIVSVPANFAEHLPQQEGRHVPAYLRVSSTSDLDCGAQLIEFSSQQSGNDIISAVS